MATDTITLDTPLKDICFTILDTETTGVNPDEGHEIIEIGMARFSGESVSDTFETLLRPTNPQTAEALSIHRIDPEELKKAPSFEETADRITGFIGDSVIAAHNLHFDMTYLDTMLRRSGRPSLQNWAIDTILLSQQVWPELTCHCLRCLGPSLKLERSGTHRALDDVMATAGLLERIIEELTKAGKNTLENLHPVREDFTWETGDVYRGLRQKINCAIRKKEIIDLLLYCKDECYYYRKTVLPVRLERNTLFCRTPGTEEEAEFPLYNIIDITPAGDNKSYEPTNVIHHEGHEEHKEP